MYFATGATHAPHHVPKEWIAKYKGKFDGGWDKYREETLRPAEAAGRRPARHASSRPSPPTSRIGTRSRPTRRGCSRGRWKCSPRLPRTPTTRSAAWCKAIEDLGELDNTLIIYEVGDNGASAEGGMIGMFNEMTYFNGVAETVPDMLKNLDKWGGPETFPHMAAGWAVAGNTPFMWTKQVASNFGGTRNPLVDQLARAHQGQGRDAQPVPARGRHRADGARSGGSARTEDGERRGADADGRRQHGVHLRRRQGRGPAQDAVFRDLRQPRDLSATAGWPPPCTRRRGKPQPRRKLAEDVWELYNVDEDFSEANDLAASNPAKLKELQALFMKEAERLPRAADRRPRRSSASTPPLAGRPDLMAGRKSLTVYEGMTGMMENAFINVKNQSVTITADVEIPAGGANGVILCQGGRFGGWSLYVKDGKPAYTYNFVGSAGVHGQRAPSGSRPASRPSSSTSPTTATAAAKAAPPRSSINGKKVGIGAHRANQRQHLLGGRCCRCGRGRRNQRQLRVQAARQRVHRQDREGAGGGQVKQFHRKEPWTRVCSRPCGLLANSRRRHMD